MNTTALFIVTMSLVLSGCSAARHRAELADPSADRVTVGTVQREIRVGMDAASVAEALGSPNIVSTDAERREVWIYDKFSTDVAYARSGGAVLGLVVGGAAAGGGSVSQSAGAARSSQRTMTVIIKFDDRQLVRDFAYRSSRF